VKKPFKLDSGLEDFPLHLRPKLETALESMEFLQEITNDDLARVPEDIFVDYLLPVLTNRTGNQSLARWQQVAGHVMRGIEVCDTQSGEPLFRVPALLRSINGDFTGTGSRSVYEIIRTAENKRRMIPALGDRHIQKHLVENVRHAAPNAKEVIAWNEILKRYGYPPILSIDTTPPSLETEGVSVSANTELPVEGFDDF
jgi:hypothetical protein